MTREEEKQEKAMEITKKHMSFCGLPITECIDAVLEMAEWADQNPREGLWDAEKVCKVLKDYMLKERFFDNRINRTAIIDNVVCDLRKAMKD